VPFPEILISPQYLRTSDNLGLRLFTHYFNIEHSIQGSILDSLFNFTPQVLVCDTLKLVQRIKICMLLLHFE
jgi:hypothetical protein